MTAKLFVEGAGPTELQRARCREAFAEFFKTAGIANRPRVVACGGRGHAFNNFATAVRLNRPDELPLLLVDSEVELTNIDTPWKHLREHDGWIKPNGATDNQVFLMVQVMETWFLADQDALMRVFGSQCDCSAIPKWPKLEVVSKVDVLRSLMKCTHNC